ncbi:MAG: sodium:solute symporter [Bacteroidia bacterium]
MSSLDWIVMGGTILAIVAYGIWKSRGSKDLQGYFLANNSMKWWTIGLSVMATQASAITFLSAPGQAYEDGMRFIQFYFGMPIAIIIIAAVIIPLYRKAQVFTAYEYLERRFDGKTRTLGALLFLTSRSIASGLTIYAPAIIMSSLLGWNIYLTCLMVGLIVIVYTTMGGTKAVSVTQKWQMAVIMVGMFIAGYFILNKMPKGMGMEEAMFAAGKMGKLNVLTMPDTWKEFLTDKYNLLSGLIGGSFLALSYFGTDQSQVQRYLGGQTTGQMRLGLIFNAIFKIPLQFAILFIGAMMFVFLSFQSTPYFFNKNLQSQVESGALGDSISSYMQDYQVVDVLRKEKLDELMALYPNGDPKAMDDRAEEARSLDSYALQLKEDGQEVLKRKDILVDKNDLDYSFLSVITKKGFLPMGLVGLLLAMVLSASMSSTSAELNALASTSINDFYRRNKTDLNESKSLRASKFMTVIWGFAAIAFSIIFSQFENLIEAVNFLGSIFYGPILGLFLAAFFMKRAKSGAVFIGGVVAQIIVLMLALKGTPIINGIASMFSGSTEPFLGPNEEISYLWFNVIGAVIVVLFALLGGRRKIAEGSTMGAGSGDFKPLKKSKPAIQGDVVTAPDEIEAILEEKVTPTPAKEKPKKEHVDKLAARMEDLSEVEKKYINAMRTRLKGLVPDMVKEMRHYTPLRDRSKWTAEGKETYLFDFETDPRDYRIRLFPSSDDATRLGEIRILPDDWPILSEGIHQIDVEQEQPDPQQYEAYRALQDKVFADWFAFCWQQAGGRVSYFPAYLTFTDSDLAYNLKRKIWERK